MKDDWFIGVVRDVLLLEVLQAVVKLPVISSTKPASQEAQIAVTCFGKTTENVVTRLIYVEPIPILGISWSTSLSWIRNHRCSAFSSTVVPFAAGL